MEHEVTMLKLRNERVNDQYEATRMKLLKEQAQQYASQTSVEESVIAKIHAEEIAKTWQESVKELRRQLKEQKLRHDETNLLVYQTSQVNNERDMMHAEEFISRYAKMEYTVKECMEEKQTNREKVEDYNNIMVLLQTIEAQRDQVIKELEEANDVIEKLEMKCTDNSADIEHLKEMHKQLVLEMVKAHNIEVNEIEQKLQHARIELASNKAASAKNMRVDRQKLAEAQKKLKEAIQLIPRTDETGATDNTNVAKKAGMLALFKVSADSHLKIDVETQTDPVSFGRGTTKRMFTKKMTQVKSQNLIKVVEDVDRSYQSISLPSNTEEPSKPSALDSDDDVNQISNDDSSDEDAVSIERSKNS